MSAVLPPLPDGWTWSIEGLGSVWAELTGHRLQVSFDGDEMEVNTTTLCGCNYGCRGCENYYYIKLPDLFVVKAACDALSAMAWEEQNAAAKAANELQKDVTK